MNKIAIIMKRITSPNRFLIEILLVTALLYQVRTPSWRQGFVPNFTLFCFFGIPAGCLELHL